MIFRRKLFLKNTTNHALLEKKWLFHGTSNEALNAIIKYGFDWRISGTTNGTLYGKGSYFAPEASKAFNYARNNKLIVSRVLTGKLSVFRLLYKFLKFFNNGLVKKISNFFLMALAVKAN